MAEVSKLFANMAGQFNAEKAADINVTMQFTLSGENGGQWYVQIADGKCDVHQGTASDPTATVMMDGDDYSDMVTGKLNPMTAFMSGKVKVDGDLGAVMKFQTLFNND